MAITELNENNFAKATSKGTVLVYFYADWCPSCRAVYSIINKLSDEKQEVSFYKINVEIEKNIAQKFAIKSIPTFAVLVDGNLKTKSVGAKSKSDILELINLR